jgi:hypothetical protein
MRALATPRPRDSGATPSIRTCIAGVERGIVLVDAGIEFERGTAEDSVVAVDGHEHERALRAARYVRDSIEILRPRPLLRTDELTVGERRHPAGLLELGGQRGADPELHASQAIGAPRLQAIALRRQWS